MSGRILTHIMIRGIDGRGLWGTYLPVSLAQHRMILPNTYKNLMKLTEQLENGKIYTIEIRILTIWLTKAKIGLEDVLKF